MWQRILLQNQSESGEPDRLPGRARLVVVGFGMVEYFAGEMDTRKAVLRDYINATIGFQELGGLTAGTSSRAKMDQESYCRGSGSAG